MMRVRLHRILSLLCVLALAFGCLVTDVLAEGGDPNYVQFETRIICVTWKDGDNYDQIRPDSLVATLAGESTGELNEANGWTGEVSVPEGTGDEWVIETPEGYTKGTPSTSNGITEISFHHSVAPLISVSATVAWEDNDDAGKIRPASVQLMLMGDGEPAGEPITVKAPAWKATWKDLPVSKPGAQVDIAYTVKQIRTPEGYTSFESGLQVTNTLQTSTLSLSASVTGAPEGSDLSGLKLKVDGPDPSMPRELTYGDLAGGTYSFGTVLPGAYLVTESNADTLVEGYTMDAKNSKVADAVYVKPGESATLQFKYAYKLPEPIEEVETEFNPQSISVLGELNFEILGPDPRLPLVVYYEVFTGDEKGGTYKLENLVPGTYTVVERNAETLVKYYTLTSSSVVGMTVKVGANGSATATLYNEYVPAPTPEPNAEFVDIPVTKTWNDNNNEHGNRPESITVRLYADGVEVDSHVLTAAEGWKFTFTQKPRYQEDNKTEIVYTVNEDVVPMYAVTINGYNIVNNYKPEVTSVSVRKVWRDNNNQQNNRPKSIAMSLSDGQKIVKIVILNAENGWSATVDNLPTVVNGQPAKYAWSEQEVLGYKLESVQQQGNTMIFTNAVWERPETPPKGKKPKTPGETWFVFEEYDTPLGVEIVINHVGDCFD